MLDFRLELTAARSIRLILTHSQLKGVKFTDFHVSINATAKCGVTWLDWGKRGNGVGDASQSYLILRNMNGDDFQQSIQNISAMTSAEKDMGPYYPVTSYSNKADFEALGCNATE